MMKKIAVEVLSDSIYCALLTTLSCENPLSIVKENFELTELHTEECQKIIVDCILHAGNDCDRFIELPVSNGKVDYNSFVTVELERHNTLRIKANDTLRKHPDVINNSILNSMQRKLLLKGISI